ncbi:MAG: hypothetical protein J5721_05825 [Lachnospiraceae bacterium]|nr:hypothetical protein [Lachnospiraceae bacterium]
MLETVNGKPSAGRGQGRMLAAALAGLLLFAFLLLSSYFLAVESGHDCHDEDCPICFCITHCENVLRQMTGDLIPAGVVSILFFLSIQRLFFHFCCLKEDTPVALRVRLNP